MKSIHNPELLEKGLRINECMKIGFELMVNITFILTGSQDVLSILSLNAAFDFWEAIGSDVIRSRIQTVLRDAVQLLTKKWNSYTLAPIHMHGELY